MRAYVDGLCSALQAEFATPILDVLLDRVHARGEVGDLAVRGTLPTVSAKKSPRDCVRNRPGRG
jgi:hypothetical protein